ncbi:MAG: regulatory protein RecX [Coriobacteriia bacterium]
MAALVTDIETPRSGARLRRIWLDGEPWRITSAAVVKAVGVAAGDVIEPSALSAEIESNERSAARDRALQLLGYRERSCFELRSRLAEDGYPPGVLDSTTGDLERIGLLDDRRFAESFVRTHLARGHGVRRMARELSATGVDELLIAEVLQPDEARESEHRRALVIARRMAVGTTDVRKLASKLVRKGYDLETSFTAAREAIAEAAGESDLF